MKTLASLYQQTWFLFTVFAIWIVTYFGARGLLENTSTAIWVRTIIALIPILPFSLTLYVLFVQIRTLDELHVRVQLEALALAFPLAMVLLMVLGLVGQALDLTYERHVWHYLPICYFIGLSLAWRRYR
ncbi:MAG: hypothetical protein Fur0022_47760 [Anaerolineales bacterium]